MVNSTTKLATTQFPVSLPVLSQTVTEHVLLILFLVSTALWLLSFTIAGYHWVRYLRSSPFFLPAITIYGGVSITLLLYAASGLVL